MTAPYFSVIIPVYNRSGTFGSTLESVLTQSFRDFECIIVDDGSADTVELRRLIDRFEDLRIRYYRQENCGAAAARNAGIDIAKGKYIAFLDSDDFYLRDKLKTDAETLERLQDPFCVLFSQVLVDRGVGRYRLTPARAPLQNERISDYLLRRLGFTQTSTLVVETELARRSRFTVGLPMAQDFDFPIRLEENGARFYMKNEPGVIWTDRDDPNRVSNMPPFEPMLKWSDSVRSRVGDKAYFAFRGSQIARLAAPRNRALALKLFLEAVVRGAMPPRLAGKSLIQVCMPRKFYRRLLDISVMLMGSRG